MNLLQAIDERIKHYEKLAKETGELEMISKMLVYDRIWSEYQDLRQLAIAEQERIVKEISSYIHTNALTEYNEGFHSATQRAIKIVKGDADSTKTEEDGVYTSKRRAG